MTAVRNISELLPDEPMPNQLDQEILFNNAVREYILLGVLVLVLVAVSHVLLGRYRRRDAPPPQPRRLRSPPLPPADDEATVDTIAMWVCTLSLSVSMGAVLLLPLSILSNEMLAIYRDSPYVRWINRSLIQGLWNMVFLLSNLSLFVALPFAYLFTEAEGFPGTKKGLRSRVVETVVVLLLLVVLVMGVAAIIALLLGYYEPTTITTTIEVWSSFYLPFLYSLVSCLGVLFLLVCTPVGLGRLFSRLKNLIHGGGCGGSPPHAVGSSSAGLDDVSSTHFAEEAVWRQLRALGYEDPEQPYMQQQQQLPAPQKKQRRPYSMLHLFSKRKDFEAGPLRGGDEDGGCHSYKPSNDQILSAQSSDDDGDGGGDRSVGAGSFFRSYSFPAFSFSSLSSSPTSTSSLLPLSCSFPTSLLPVAKNREKSLHNGDVLRGNLGSFEKGIQRRNKNDPKVLVDSFHDCENSSGDILRQSIRPEFSGADLVPPREGAQVSSGRHRAPRKGVGIPVQSSSNSASGVGCRSLANAHFTLDPSTSPANYNCPPDMPVSLDSRDIRRSPASHKLEEEFPANHSMKLSSADNHSLQFSPADQSRVGRQVSPGRAGGDEVLGDTSKSWCPPFPWGAGGVADVTYARRRHSFTRINGGKWSPSRVGKSSSPVPNERVGSSQLRDDPVLKKCSFASPPDESLRTKPWEFPPSSNTRSSPCGDARFMTASDSINDASSSDCKTCAAFGSSVDKLQGNPGNFGGFLAGCLRGPGKVGATWSRSHSVPARPVAPATSASSGCRTHTSQVSLECPTASSQSVTVSHFPRSAQFPRPLHGKSLNQDALLHHLEAVLADRRRLESSSRRGLLRRCLVYPLGVLVLVLVTGVVVVLVVFNVLQLISGFKSLPHVLYKGTRTDPDPSGGVMLGKRAVLVWVLGPLGAAVEVALILYLCAASLVGCYSLPLMRRVAPVGGDTPMVHLILNCALLLVMASALPLLATTLGLTNLDLLGDYGSVGWLGNLWIVLTYNVLFAAAALCCLLQQFSGAVRGELYDRLGAMAEALLRRTSAEAGTGFYGSLREAFCRRLLAASQRHKFKRR